jgi:hypothetical protein
MTDSNLPIVVDIDLKESDLQRANFWFGLKSWSNRLMLIVMPIAGILLLWRVEFSTVSQTPLAAIGSIVFITFPIFYFVMIWLQTKRGFANLQPFQAKVRYSFSREGYNVNDPKSAADISWDSVLRVEESNHGFQLFFGRTLFHTIPKRCFNSVEDIVRLRTLLRQTLGSKAVVS